MGVWECGGAGVWRCGSGWKECKTGSAYHQMPGSQGRVRSPGSMGYNINPHEQREFADRPTRAAAPWREYTRREKGHGLTYPRPPKSTNPLHGGEIPVLVNTLTGKICTKDLGGLPRLNGIFSISSGKQLWPAWPSRATCPAGLPTEPQTGTVRRPARAGTQSLICFLASLRLRVKAFGFFSVESLKNHESCRE